MDLDRRVLRIAPVMTGGTSLAVWMGGATVELYRLLRAADREAPGPGVESGAAAVGSGAHLYRSLLELTRTDVEIDVLTGTSAGGLNAALLATAVRKRTPIDDVVATREVWQRAGDIDHLLRRPDERDPPSLLDGTLFEAEVEAALRHLGGAGGGGDDGAADSAPRPDVDLVVTVTTIHPDPVLRHDSTGVEIHEVDHAQQLRFRGDQLDAPGWSRKLAIAARTSAGIPGVFEPRLLTVGGDGTEPNLGEHASFVGSRWAVDGGVVANLPLAQALDRIYDRPAEDEVRRVVLFIVPTPRREASTGEDRIDRSPTILESSLTVVTGPRAEGIATDIDRIEHGNARVREQEELRRTLEVLERHLGDHRRDSEEEDHADRAAPLVDELLLRYRVRRAEASIRTLLDRFERIQSGHRPLDRADLVAQLAPVRRALLPRHLEPVSDPERWAWGIRPVEHAVATAIGLLARAVANLDDASLRRRLLESKSVLHRHREQVAAIRRIDERHLVARLAERGQPPEPATLAGWYETWPFADEREVAASAADLAVLVQPMRAEEVDGGSHHVGVGAVDAGDVDVADDPTGPLPPEGPRPDSGSLTVAGSSIDPLDAARQRVTAVLGRIFLDVAGRLAAAERVLAEAAGRDLEGREKSGGGDRTGPSEVLAELRALVGRTATGTADDSVAVSRRAARLLRTHVLQVALLGDLVEREQHVDLVVCSSDAPNALDPGRSPDAKLAGPKVARLGAFLDPSWRANDWMWGRLDAAHRLVLLLLDPARLRRVDPDAEGLRALIEPHLPGVGAEARSAIESELRRLVESSAELRVMPATAGLLAGAIQREIAREELPRVAMAVDEARRRGSPPDDGGRFRDAVAAVRRRTADRAEPLDPAAVPDEVVDELLGLLRVGDERVELRRGAGRSTAVRAASVAVNALTGTRSGLPDHPVLGVLRLTARALASAARAVEAVRRRIGGRGRRDGGM